MSVTIINPPLTFTRRNDISYPQSLGVLYLASFLRQNGEQVSVIDTTIEGHNCFEKVDDGLLRVGLSMEDIAKRVPAETELIGISVPVGDMSQYVHDLVDFLKKQFEDIPIVLGGLYPSTQPDLALTSSADYIIRGEGEIALYQLLKMIRDGQSEKLPGGVSSKSSGVRSPVVIANLDSLPFPARDLVPFEKGLELTPMNPGLKTAIVTTSRGCPYTCSFCSTHNVSGRRFRVRSVDNIIDEITMLIGDYNIDHIELIDDLISFDRDRFLELISRLDELSSRHKLSWSCALKVELVDKKLLEVISKSNCLRINMPIEHGTEALLKKMNKNFSLSHALDIFRYAGELNIIVYIQNIVGYPGETDEIFNESLGYYVKIKEANPTVRFFFQIAQPYPGTRLFDLCSENGYIPSSMCSSVETNPYHHTIYTALIETNEFSKRDVKSRIRKLNWHLERVEFWKNCFRRFFPQSMLRAYRKIKYHF